MELSHEDVRRLLQIVDESPNLDEVRLSVGELQLHVRRSPGTNQSVAASAAPMQVAIPALATAAVTARPVLAPAAVAQSPASAASARQKAVPEGWLAIRAPMVGTFFRSPAPGELPFVEEGQRVKAEDTVCLIEVMKLFNSVSAGVNGIVREIRVADGALVEYGEVILVVQPDGAAA